MFLTTTMAIFPAGSFKINAKWSCIILSMYTSARLSECKPWTADCETGLMRPGRQRPRQTLMIYLSGVHIYIIISYLVLIIRVDDGLASLGKNVGHLFEDRLG